MDNGRTQENGLQDKKIDDQHKALRVRYSINGPHISRKGVRGLASIKEKTRKQRWEDKKIVFQATNL